MIGIDVDAAGATNPIIDEFRPIPADFRWPVADASVDLAIARSVLEHVPNPESFFNELARVVKPGGYFVAHTPNRFGYPAIAAVLIPNRHHAKIVGYAQGDREEQDVFPTLYRCNTKGASRDLLESRRFDVAVHGWEAEPGYLAFSRTLFRVASWFHRLIPQPLQTVLFVYARKREARRRRDARRRTPH